MSAVCTKQFCCYHDNSCSPHQIPKSLVQIKHSTQSARPAPQPVKFDPTRTIQAPKGQAEGIRALVEVRSIVCPREVNARKRYYWHSRSTKNTTYEGGHPRLVQSQGLLPYSCMCACGAEALRSGQGCCMSASGSESRISRSMWRMS